jgi:hypothetical protein
MQRLHENDLSGHLLEQGGWDHICWPMRFDASRPDPRDPRKASGELLWPALFTEEKVRQLEIDLGPYATAGQMQQRPAPAEGGLFKEAWFPKIDVVPEKLIMSFAAGTPQRQTAKATGRYCLRQRCTTKDGCCG